MYYVLCNYVTTPCIGMLRSLDLGFGIHLQVDRYRLGGGGRKAKKKKSRTQQSIKTDEVDSCSLFFFLLPFVFLIITKRRLGF